MRVSRTAHLRPVRQPVWEKNVGLYRDNGLAAFEDISGPQAERIKKDITKFFTSLGLKITIKTNLKIVDFLDVTLNLSNGTYLPFRKPNDHPLYINTKSNHPPAITKHLPAAISRRVSEISCNKELFEKAKPDYQQALTASGYTEDLTYTVTTENENVNKKRTEKEKSFGSTHHTAKVCRQTSEKLSSAYFRNISRKTTNFTKFSTRTLLK